MTRFRTVGWAGGRIDWQHAGQRAGSLDAVTSGITSTISNVISRARGLETPAVEPELPAPAVDRPATVGRTVGSPPAKPKAAAARSKPKKTVKRAAKKKAVTRAATVRKRARKAAKKVARNKKVARTKKGARKMSAKKTMSASARKNRAGLSPGDSSLAEALQPTGTALAHRDMGESMSNDDVTWWKPSSQDRNQDRQTAGTDKPGDTDAADIVGRTGEEMPEVAHDEGGPDPHVTKQDTPVLPGVDAQDPDSMPRAEDDEATREKSPEFLIGRAAAGASPSDIKFSTTSNPQRPRQATDSLVPMSSLTRTK